MFVLLLIFFRILLLTTTLLRRRSGHGLDGLLHGLIIGLGGGIPGIEFQGRGVARQGLLPLLALLVRILFGFSRTIAGVAQIIPTLLLQSQIRRAQHLFEQSGRTVEIVHAVGSRPRIETETEIVGFLSSQPFVFLT